jgi:hypothetical protein
MSAWLDGSCHCGRVAFRVQGPLDAAIVCNCSICTMKGFLHFIVPPERFELVRGRDELTTYRFNTRVAEHTFCRHCGVHPFYRPRSHPDHIDVNVRCLAGIELSTLLLRDFDGRHWDREIDALLALR